MKNLTLEQIQEKIDEYNSLKQYTFPFNNGIRARAIIDDTFTFEDFKNNEESRKTASKKYLFTDAELKSQWKVVLKQRIFYQAAQLVLSGKFIAMNPALKSLGYII